MSGHRCKQNPDETGEHEWVKRTDSMGDPDGRYGELTWQVDVCRWCGVEQQELEEPDECPQCGSTRPHFHGDESGDVWLGV